MFLGVNSSRSWLLIMYSRVSREKFKPASRALSLQPSIIFLLLWSSSCMLLLLGQVFYTFHQPIFIRFFTYSVQSQIFFSGPDQFFQIIFQGRHSVSGSGQSDTGAIGEV